MDEVHCGNEELHPVSIKYFNFVWHVRVPTLKFECFTGFLAHYCVRTFSVLAQLAFVLFGAVPVRIAVCEQNTKIDYHLQNATSEPERKLWLEFKKDHSVTVHQD